MLHLDCGAEIRCRVVLLALGVRWRRLEAEGADRFTGAGIYYACTTVEADLYDGTDVAVVGAGNSAGQAVMFLAECCPTRKVHLLIRRTLGPGMSEYLANRIRATANVVVHEQTEIDAVHGNRRLEEITLKNQRRRAPRRLPCSAVFVFIGAEPSADWLPSEIGRDAKGYLLTGTDVVRSGLWPLHGSRPVSAGNDASRRAGRGRHSLRFDQARRFRGWRRLAGGYLRPSIALDPTVNCLRNLAWKRHRATDLAAATSRKCGSRDGASRRAWAWGQAWVVGDVLKCDGAPADDRPGRSRPRAAIA